MWTHHSVLYRPKADEAREELIHLVLLICIVWMSGSSGANTCIDRLNATSATIAARRRQGRDVITFIQ